MTQKRYTDRGRPYDHEAWRALYRETLSPGVYSGFNISPSTTTGTVEISPGSLLLPSGIVVVEDSEVFVSIPGTFPPASATDYTIFTSHSEAAIGLIGGEAMSYGASSSLLTSQPDDGVILGWIRHPGGAVALSQDHIIDAPKFAPADIAADYVARQPACAPAPFLVTVFGQGVTRTEGSSPKVYRGFTNTTTAVDSDTGMTPVATSYFPFKVHARPYQINLVHVIPVGDQIKVDVLTDSGAVATTETIPGTGAEASTTIDVTLDSTYQWTQDSIGQVVLTSTIAVNTEVKIINLEVNFWPYALPQFGLSSALL